MSHLGQTRKYSWRAYVFRSSLISRHRADALACPKGARRRHRGLFDHLVSAAEQRGQRDETECGDPDRNPGGPAVERHDGAA